MWRKGLLGTLLFLTLAACDSTEPQTEPISPVSTSEVLPQTQPKPQLVKDPALLAERYQKIHAGEPGN